MATLTDIHDLIDAQLRLPVSAPKIYVLGDTGAGKSTVLQHILGTKRQAFPSALKRRTTVAITEYVIDKTVPYAACFLLKSAVEVLTSIEEILEYSQASIIKLIRKDKEINLKDVIDNLGESPDQRFRLKYIVSEGMLEIFSAKLIESSISAIDNYEIGFEQPFIKELAKNIFDVVQDNLRKYTDLTLTEKQITHLVKYDDRDSCIDSAKLFLKAGKNSLSPLVSYARIQGGFGADWLPENSSFVIIDGEGIGHDIKESAILSARHLDYFKICDAIVVAEGAGKPFAAGGKSAIQGVIQNGYVDNLYLMMTKLDELIDEDAEEQTDFEDRIHDVRHEFKNLEQALKSSGIEEDRWLDNVSYIEGLKEIETPDQSIIRRQLPWPFRVN
jgi:energy-coupling factor transporter ATP-binding protein EcfA2